MKFEVDMKTAKEIADIIENWEHEAGEDFTDYFLHDAVIISDWTQFLRNKGFDERSRIIEDENANGNNSICQMLLFNVHLCYAYYDDQSKKKEHVGIEHVEYAHEPSKWDDLYAQDLLLWAEFILSDSHYLNEFERKHFPMC